jgi:PAS domain S-box-containing protein
MERKTYIPAMNSKIIPGLWFVLFAVLVLLVNWLFTRPLDQVNALEERLLKTDKLLVRLKALQTEYILSFEQAEQLFPGSDLSLEQESRTLLAGINNDLDFYGSIRYLNRDSDIAAALRDFSETMSEYHTSLNDLMLAYRERGGYNSGLIARWRELSQRMITVSNPPGNELLQKIYAMKQAEADYLVQKDSHSLEQISVLCETIRGELSPEEGGIALSDIDHYLSLTGNLIALEKRIGSTGTGGILAQQGKAIEQLPVIFSNLERLMLESGRKNQVRWIILRICALLLIMGGCIFLYIRFSGKVFFDPLKVVSARAHQMAQGELPDVKIMAGRLPDMITLQESLEKLVAGLRDKVAFTRSLNDKKMDTRLALLGDNDLLGLELADLQQKIIDAEAQQLKNEEENLRRRYINEGLAKFAEILRAKSNDLNALGDAFIREMVKYLNAIQGGFFVFDDSDKSAPVLNLVSAFAYNRKKFLQQSIAFGEGLIGTCAREKQPINLTEIPAGYISITSGLGDTLPDNLMLMPVLHEHELIGVLEIASLHKFKEHEIAFAEEVARNLGSTIVYTRNNQRTADLLTRSQQQALEMAEQEEEMRQNMEELKATQEESSRREEEFKGIADAIDRALFVIEYDLEGHIRNVNDRFCIFKGCSLEDVIGRTHHEIMEGTLKPDRQFWDELQRHSQHTCTEQVKIGKARFTLKEHFTTVRNRDGLTVKFINFATDD